MTKGAILAPQKFSMVWDILVVDFWGPIYIGEGSLGDGLALTPGFTTGKWVIDGQIDR